MIIVAEAGGRQVRINVVRPSWADMYKSYPKENIKSSHFYEMVSKAWVLEVAKNPRSWQNSCAARMSCALNRSGIKLSPPKSRAMVKGDDGYIYWIRVTDLSGFLEEKFKKGDVEYNPKQILSMAKENIDARAAEIQNNFLQKIKGKHGVVVFHVTGWGDATGHFTLWDGANLLYVGEPSHNDPRSTEYYFWLMRDRGDGG